MIRAVGLCLLGAAMLTAQEKPAVDLTAPRQTVEKTAADSDTLAKDLETRLAHLLPCDPRARRAIEDVSRASDARLAALRVYLEALVTKTREDSDAVKRLIAERDALAAETASDSADAQEQRDGIEGQLLELGESVKRRAALEDAQKTLAGIAGAARQRATQAQEQAPKLDALGGLLKTLGAAYQERQRAIQNELTALDAESARWVEYYAARSARAQTECSIINQTPARPVERKTQ